MRAGLLIAVLLLTACTGAPFTSPTAAPIASPTLITSPTPAPSPTAAEPVRILQTGLSSIGFENPFSVAAATNRADYDALWLSFGLRSVAPEVDFEREIVLYLGMAGSSSCPEVFQRLVVDEDAGRVFAEWQTPPPNQPCTDDLQAQGVLLAVARDQLPSQQFMLSLRQQPICPDCPDHPDQTVVDPSA